MLSTRLITRYNKFLYWSLTGNRAGRGTKPKDIVTFHPPANQTFHRLFHLERGAEKGKTENIQIKKISRGFLTANCKALCVSINELTRKRQSRERAGRKAS